MQSQENALKKMVFFREDLIAHTLVCIHTDMARRAKQMPGEVPEITIENQCYSTQECLRQRQALNPWTGS